MRWHEKVGRREAWARVAELMHLVGITDPLARLGQFPHELSGGMKQRVCIARALLCNPALVLADEPTTNLDVTIQAQILELLDELKRRLGTSMILVTHDMGVVARMADRIVVMYAGRICEIARRPNHLPQPAAPVYAGASREHAARRPELRALTRRAAAGHQGASAQSARPAERMPLPPALPGSRCPNAVGSCPR